MSRGLEKDRFKLHLSLQILLRDSHYKDMNLYLKKISVELEHSHTCQFMLVTRCEDDKKININLFALSDSEAYAGFAGDVQLRSMAATLRMTFKDYLNDTLKALQLINENSVSEFLYCLEQDNGDMYFRWKKIIEKGEVRINLGRVKMSKNEYHPAMEILLCDISKELYDMRSKLDETLKQLKESIEREKNTHDILEKAIEAKDNIEHELFSKFVMVLNLKKQKIKQLKHKQDSSDEDMSPKLIKRTRHEDKTPNYLHISENVVCEDSESTDEGIRNEPGPSNKPSNTSFLLFDDSDSEIPYPAPKLRQRQRKLPGRNCQQECEESAASVHVDILEAQTSLSDDDRVENLLEML